MLFFDKLQDGETMFSFKGVVATTGNLPATSTVGDFYQVTADGHFYAWNGTAWTDLGTGLKGVLLNTATGSYSLTISGTPTNRNGATNVGIGSKAGGYRATSYGDNAEANAEEAGAYGFNAKVTGARAVQLGAGTNNTADTLKYRGITVINASGKIPAEIIDGFATSQSLTNEVNDRQEADEDLQSQIDTINPTTYTGFDATKTQILKNISGTLTWVDEQ